MHAFLLHSRAIALLLISISPISCFLFKYISQLIVLASNAGKFDYSWHFFYAFQMLCNILVFAKTVPSLFAPYFEDFFICSSDPYHIRALKLEILSTIATESSVPIIFEEFQVFTELYGHMFCVNRNNIAHFCWLCQ